MSASIDPPAQGPRSLEQLAYRAGRLIGRGEAQVRRLPAPPPWLVLGLLILASWGIAVESGRISQHNGWLYDHGGDGTWYYTTAWALAHGHLPIAVIGYGYSLLLAPIAAVAGPNLLHAMPAIVVFNELVLAPIALVCIYGIVRLYASRWYAYLATLLWVIFPVLVIHYFLAKYHPQYVDMTLPSEIGLTGLGDFPSMVVLLVAAYFTLRHIETHAGVDAVAAGLAAGIALTVKPANLLFLPAAVATLLVARRSRGLGLFVLALLPGVIGLAIWKYRGLGYLPAFQSAAPLAMVLPVVAGLGPYLPGNLWHLHHNLDGLREYTWSQRMIYFTVGGGLVGLVRRSLPAAVLSGVWLAAYVVDKGSSATVDIVQGTFFTHMIAAFPAYFLLVVSLPFLVPIYGRRRPAAPVGPSSSQRLPRVSCWVLGAVVGVGLVLVTVLPQLSPTAAAEIPPLDLYMPLNGFPVAARTTPGAVTLSWPASRPTGSRTAYAILRSPAGVPVCTPFRDTRLCPFNGVQIGSVDTKSGPLATSFTDHPAPGAWTYRVALSATPYGPQTGTDYVLISRPVTVTVRPGSAGQ